MVSQRLSWTHFPQPVCKFRASVSTASSPRWPPLTPRPWQLRSPPSLPPRHAHSAAPRGRRFRAPRSSTRLEWLPPDQSACLAAARRWCGPRRRRQRARSRDSSTM
ncbi:hypothetical protein CLOP_g24305 [Closterium sp. NIES-67]|nr:hypothetical protein CLOP_g24305 [Closterium sp. NIES-67]